MFAGLRIAVDDSEHVRVRETLQCLQRVVDRVADRETLLEAKELLEIAPVEALHHHVRQAVRERSDVDDACDVCAVDARRRACFGQEPVDDLRQARQIRREIFTAIGLSSKTWCAAKTTAIPPSPSWPSIRYLSASTSPTCGNDGDAISPR